MPDMQQLATTTAQSLITSPEATSSIASFLLRSLGMTLTCLAIPRLRLTSIFGAMLMVGSLSLINHLLWDPQLFNALPHDLTQRSVYILLSNGALFWVLVKLLPGIEISGILPAIFAPIVFALVSLAISTYAPLVDWQAVAEFITHTISTFRNSLKS